MKAINIKTGIQLGLALLIAGSQVYSIDGMARPNRPNRDRNWGNNDRYYSDYIDNGYRGNRELRWAHSNVLNTEDDFFDAEEDMIDARKRLKDTKEIYIRDYNDNGRMKNYSLYSELKKQQDKQGDISRDYKRADNLVGQYERTVEQMSAEVRRLQEALSNARYNDEVLAQAENDLRIKKRAYENALNQSQAKTTEIARIAKRLEVEIPKEETAINKIIDNHTKAIAAYQQQMRNPNLPPVKRKELKEKVRVANQVVMDQRYKLGDLRDEKLALIPKKIGLEREVKALSVEGLKVAFVNSQKQYQAVKDGNAAYREANTKIGSVKRELEIAKENLNAAKVNKEEASRRFEKTSQKIEYLNRALSVEDRYRTLVSRYERNYDELQEDYYYFNGISSDLSYEYSQLAPPSNMFGAQVYDRGRDGVLDRYSRNDASYENFDLEITKSADEIANGESVRYDVNVEFFNRDGEPVSYRYNRSKVYSISSSESQINIDLIGDFVFAGRSSRSALDIDNGSHMKIEIKSSNHQQEELVVQFNFSKPLYKYKSSQHDRDYWNRGNRRDRHSRYYEDDYRYEDDDLYRRYGRVGYYLDDDRLPLNYNVWSTKQYIKW